MLSDPNRPREHNAASNRCDCTHKHSRVTNELGVLISNSFWELSEVLKLCQHYDIKSYYALKHGTGKPNTATHDAKKRDRG